MKIFRSCNKVYNEYSQRMICLSLCLNIRIFPQDVCHALHTSLSCYTFGAGKEEKLGHISIKGSANVLIVRVLFSG